MMVLMSGFVIFHIIYYSYDRISKVITLAIFVPVVALLLFTNLISFFAISWDNIFSGLL